MHIDIDKIRQRRQEVAQKIGWHHDQIADLEKEQNDLDITLRTLERMSGAKWSAPRQADEREPEAEPRAKPEDLPPMPELIRQALGSLAKPSGARPKEVREWIAKNRWPDVPRDSAATVLWRMLQRGDVVKIGPRYKLSETKETADSPNKETSAASLFQPEAQGRKAEDPGGGTCQ